ncbi:MAG TPA: VWA domain-containing protein [Terriglobia bacterium]|nr:VWA domain-containing protein [Terriglobia bacterium]
MDIRAGLRGNRGSARWTPLLAVLAGALALAPAVPQEPPELTTHDSQPTFQLHVQHNEVMVRVVVRDAQGRPVTNLKQDDFRIFDNRKPQFITHFSLEVPAAPARAPSPPPPSTGGAPAQAAAPPAITIIPPTRFTALFFDDLHIEFADLVRTRQAAEGYVAANLRAGDRVAVFTSSGQNQIGFTADRQRLRETIEAIHPRPIGEHGAGICPPISDYQAYMISREQDPTALQLAEQDALYMCCNGHAPCAQMNDMYLESLAAELLQDVEQSGRYSLRGLQDLCRQMAVLPGQRSIVFVSPGFLTNTLMYELEEVIDEALRQNVVIGTLDARGLYAETNLGDASQEVPLVTENPSLVGVKRQYVIASRQADADVLASVAEETGGFYFHNNNDFAEGFRRASGLPEAYYVLSFAPSDLEPNGHMHTLKVTLADNPAHYSLLARKAYFAPNKAEDAATLAAEQVERAVFSPAELQAIPLEVHTQFFKPAADTAKLTVFTHVNIHGVRFQKAEGRNADTLTIVTALFDQGGNPVAGLQKNVDFRLRDATLAKMGATGFSVKASFDLRPGTYLVRSVVRDSVGEQIGATSQQVEIP